MRVETNTYFNSHLKNPRGFGGWLFEFSGGGFDLGAFAHTGLYGEAKKAAVKKAREVGATTVRVLP